MNQKKQNIASKYFQEGETFYVESVFIILYKKDFPIIGFGIHKYA